MRITYLFDPLCGWCYGAGPAIEWLAGLDGVSLELTPTGLFAGEGARPMEAHFAAYAWQNDQRISRLTAQPFTETYRTRVLGAVGAMFDSAPATIGLVAVGLSQPERELEALKALQHARYVDGRNTTTLAAVTDLLAGAGFAEAADRLRVPDQNLLLAYRQRTAAAREEMAHFGADGVPALLIGEAGERRLLRTSGLFGRFDLLADSCRRRDARLAQANHYHIARRYIMTTKLTWQHFPAGPNGFFRAPVLLSGPTEALLIDGGFTYPDGRALAQTIKATGKTLTDIYVSQSDPDYYFSLKPIREAFPDARVIAASDTIAAINANVEKKLATWGPQLKENGPQTLADIVRLEAFDGPTLTVDGETVEIVAADGLANRRYLWVPTLNAVFGGVLIFSGVHIWTADTPTKAQRAAWIANLDEIAARNPSVVIPGHMDPTAPTGLAAIEHTKAYLLAFEEELARGGDSVALKAALEARFPILGMGVALNIGSKVATGEMQWG